MVDRAPTPATEQGLCRFVARLEEEGLAHSTIKGYLAAVRHLHLEEGKDDPRMGDMARLQLVLRGVKSSQAKHGGQGRLRLPISAHLLAELKMAWVASSSPEGAMLWAASSLCFFGFFRSGEITVPEGSEFDGETHLSLADLAVDSRERPTMLRVRLKTSKTDPFRKGVDVFVGKTGSELCPLEAMLAYLKVRGWKKGPLFILRNGQALTRPRFVVEVQKALASRGTPAKGYSGHSFRCGAATTAAARGIGEATIKMLGRWSSSALQLYIKTPREDLAKLTPVLAGGQQTTSGIHSHAIPKLLD